MATDVALPLVSLPENRLALFTEEKGLVPILDALKVHAADFIGDVFTSKGRAEITTFCYKIKRSKTFIEAEGKKLADAQKDIPKKIDAARKLAWNTLEALETQVRAPLTKWEIGEKARVDKHTNAIDMLGNPDISGTAADIKARLDAQEGLAEKFTKEICEEYLDDYIFALEGGTGKLQQAHAAKVAAEAEAKRIEEERAELARLRKIEEDRKAADAKAAADKAQADREAEIARVAREEGEAAAAAKLTAAPAAAPAPAPAFHVGEVTDTPAPMVGADRVSPAPEPNRAAAVVSVMDAAIAPARARTPIAEVKHRKQIEMAISQALREKTGLRPDACDSVAAKLCEGVIPHVTVSFWRDVDRPKDDIKALRDACF